MIDLKGLFKEMCDKLINWIMEYITAITLHHACKCKTWRSLHLLRGIWQGDPIVFLYFYFCVEYLVRYIYFMSTLKSSGIRIKLTKDSSIISYLMFADDCLIFCRATEPAARVVKTHSGVLYQSFRSARQLSQI